MEFQSLSQHKFTLKMVNSLLLLKKKKKIEHQKVSIGKTPKIMFYAYNM
jgi:hypothetical protein